MSSTEYPTQSSDDSQENGHQSGALSRKLLSYHYQPKVEDNLEVFHPVNDYFTTCFELYDVKFIS